MIGLPLRLLAREIYDRMVGLKGKDAIALITGEEKIMPRLPSYFVCTVEAMPLDRQVDIVVIDEIQLCSDPERGHIFTQRLLNMRGRFETLVLGATSFGPLFQKLFPKSPILYRDRLSKLEFTGSKKLTRLPPRTAIIAFSSENVYAIAELIRRQKGGAAVVMGGLSPKTRNAQVSLFETGEVDYLVATDAIGMGLNMDIHHVAFSALMKFDGKRLRSLKAQEIGQIAGRAGRFRRDGSFGITGECDEMDQDLIEAIENHRYDPLTEAEWRQNNLSFQSYEALIASLNQSPDHYALHRAQEAIDEKTLQRLAQDEDIAPKLSNPITLKILWDVCQLPDFRKLGLEEHCKLVSFLFHARTGRHNFIPEDWFLEQLQLANRDDGDVEALSARLSHIRTLAYISQRSKWLARPEIWQGETKKVEETLSDRLHQALMQRFVDARTSVLLKALNSDLPFKANLSREGTISMNGQVLGRMEGLKIVYNETMTQVDERLIRTLAQRSTAPLVLDRLKAIAQANATALSLKERIVYWQGEAVAELISTDLFAPEVRLLTDADHSPLLAQTLQRLNAFVRQCAEYDLRGLFALKALVDNKKTAFKALTRKTRKQKQSDVYQWYPPNDQRLLPLKSEPLPEPSPRLRAIAFRLVESHGFCLRLKEDALEPADRAWLKMLGIRVSRLTFLISSLRNTKAESMVRAMTNLDSNSLSHLSLTLGQDLIVNVKEVEIVEKIMDKAGWSRSEQALIIDPQYVNTLNLSEDRLHQILTALGYHKLPPPKLTPTAAKTSSDGQDTPEVALEASPNWPLRYSHIKPRSTIRPSRTQGLNQRPKNKDQASDIAQDSDSETRSQHFHKPRNHKTNQKGKSQRSDFKAKSLPEKIETKPNPFSPFAVLKDMKLSKK
jgi:ATP-dependent RNA helicase SUPV3L1/SUV3